MSYPNIIKNISTNSITIEDVRETCEKERVILKNDILSAAKNISENNSGSTQEPPELLTQNVTRAMGDFWFSIDGTIPPGGLPHLGHIVERNIYSDFFTWISDTKTILTDDEWLAYAESHDGCCPFYSSGNGSTTFRTPKYDNVFLKTISSINGAGVYEEEGLPNIKGVETSIRGSQFPNTIEGSFYGFINTLGKTGMTYNATSAATSGYRQGFDASLSSPIYGNSDHVTPKNISFMIGVYAIGAIVPVGTTDAEKIMSGVTRVEGLLDSKIDKVSVSSYVTETWVSGISGYRIYSDGFIEQWGEIPKSATSVTLLKSYSNTNYCVLMIGRNYGSHDQGLGMTTNTISTFTVNASSYTRSWYACGY